MTTTRKFNDQTYKLAPIGGVVKETLDKLLAQGRITEAQHRANLASLAQNSR